MLNNWKVEASIATVAFCTTLFFVGCNTTSDKQSNGGPSITTEVQAAPVESPMKHMNMAKKSSEATNKPATTANANEILIENFTFQPASLSVKAGTKVTWVNRDDEPHTATEDNQRFNSKTLDTNDQFSFTFTQPGTYTYFCALHPKMRGQIVVK